MTGRFGNFFPFACGSMTALSHALNYVILQLRTFPCRPLFETDAITQATPGVRLRVTCILTRFPAVITGVSMTGGFGNFFPFASGSMTSRGHVLKQVMPPLQMLLISPPDPHSDLLSTTSTHIHKFNFIHL